MRTLSAAVLAAVAIALATAAPAAAEPNVIATYHLDETGNGATTTPDASGHGLTGVDFSGELTTGHFGSGMVFQGQPNGFRVANDPLLEPKSVTVLAWVRFGG